MSPSSIHARARRRLHRTGLALTLAVALTGGLQLTASAETNPLVPTEVVAADAPTADGPRSDADVRAVAEGLQSETLRSAPAATAARAAATKKPTFDAYAVPSCATSNQPAQLHVAIESNQTQDVAYTLTRGVTVLTSGTVHVKAKKEQDFSLPV